MMRFGIGKPEAVPEIERPVLDLSGPRLTRSFDILVERSDTGGGIEAYISSLSVKAALFHESLKPERLTELDEETFTGLCAFIAPVRRRVGAWLKDANFTETRQLITDLLTGTSDVDARLATFCEAFPTGREYRWVRDLAAELLHYSDPEQYPLMARWVWDRQANSGVLREIWFADDIDHLTLEIPDSFATFQMLREELSQFLSSNGVFRDMLYYVDLLMAQVYADYICEQGSSFLRTDFTSEIDPLEFTRRMLGLDGVDTESGVTRVKLADNKRYRLPDFQNMH
jgi:hypothetical protein